MGFGILEDKVLTHVPGTVILDEETARNDLVSGLKHATGKNSHIVLAPQPSEDPNDPLNWPRWQRDSCFCLLLLSSVLCPSVNAPLLNTSFVLIAEHFDQSIAEVVKVGSGYVLLVTGASGPFYCALSRKFGKRPVFLFSIFMAILGTLLGELSYNNWNLLVAARLVAGFCISAYESILVAAIGDLFFVHQRGWRVSATNFAINVTSQFVTLISGQISNNLGWIWLYHILQMFMVPLFILVFLFCPETTYNREKVYDTDVLRDDHLETLAETEKVAAVRQESAEAAQIERPNVPVKKTFYQSLAVYTGVYSHDNIIKLFLAPFVTLLNFAALYTCIAAGLLQAWYVGTAIIQTQLFAAPPYLLDAAQIGYLSVGPLLGGIIGTLGVGLTADPIAKWATRRNSGIYEPEFRLLPTPIGAVIFAAGMFGYGWTVQAGGSVYLCVFLNGMMLCGALTATSSLFVYALDAYRSSSNEIFIMNMVFKNFMFYGLSNFVSNWALYNGAGQVMSVFAGTGLFLCLLAIPFYIYGKRLRSYWSRHNLLVKWGFNTEIQEPVIH